MSLLEITECPLDIPLEIGLVLRYTMIGLSLDESSKTKGEGFSHPQKAVLGDAVISQKLDDGFCLLILTHKTTDQAFAGRGAILNVKESEFSWINANGVGDGRLLVVTGGHKDKNFSDFMKNAMGDLGNGTKGGMGIGFIIENIGRSKEMDELTLQANEKTNSRKKENDDVE